MLFLASVMSSIAVQAVELDRREFLAGSASALANTRVPAPRTAAVDSGLVQAQLRELQSNGWWWRLLGRAFELSFTDDQAKEEYYCCGVMPACLQNRLPKIAEDLASVQTAMAKRYNMSVDQIRSNFELIWRPEIHTRPQDLEVGGIMEYFKHQALHGTALAKQWDFQMDFLTHLALRQREIFGVIRDDILPSWRAQSRR